MGRDHGFQENRKKLLPEWLELKCFKENICKGTKLVLKKCFILPTPYLGFSELIGELEERFKESRITLRYFNLLSI
ncbi:MAG: hypothetical protein ACP5K8_09125 [Nitrososphaeria archaeon]